MSFMKTCGVFFWLLLLWRFHRIKAYVDICEEPHQSIYCSCDITQKETAVTCFIFGVLRNTDKVWSSLGDVDNAVSVTLLSRLPTRLDYIPSESLMKMPQLQSLVVQEGNLTQLQAYSVSNMTNLKRLMLERNDITSLELNAIFNLPRLKKLALSENLLNELMADSLVGLVELEQLFLDRNNISRIESCAFCELQNLKELELWGNQITDLTEYTFRGLRYLRRLDLYKNYIKILNDKVFHTMPRLLEIDLKDNLIDYISPRAFRGLESLQRLMLNQNRLKTIPDKVFKTLSNLRFIDLYNNQLETLHAGVLENIVNAKDEHFSIMLRENPFKCSCDLRWVHHYLKTNKSHQFTRELTELKCTKEDNELEHVRLLKLHCKKSAEVPNITSSSVMISPIETLTKQNYSATIQSAADYEDEEMYFSDIEKYSAGCLKTDVNFLLILCAMLSVLILERCQR